MRRVGIVVFCVVGVALGSSACSKFASYDKAKQLGDVFDASIERRAYDVSGDGLTGDLEDASGLLDVSIFEDARLRDSDQPLDQGPSEGVGVLDTSVDAAPTSSGWLSLIKGDFTPTATAMAGGRVFVVGTFAVGQPPASLIASSLSYSET